MKPRNKLQVLVLSLSQKLNGLTNEQAAWALKNCTLHIAYSSKTKTSCLDCGHVWAGMQKGKTCICPACAVKLTVVPTRMKLLTQERKVMAVFTVVEEFQVVRLFEVSSSHKAGTKAQQAVTEIVQQWFKPNGKLSIIAKNVNMHNYGWHGALEIRNTWNNYYTSNKYDVWADATYPMVQCLPIYKRNGFSGKVQGIQPYSFFRNLLSDSRMETLLKSKQFGLVRSRMNSNQNSMIYRFWDSIKICIRQKYVVKDGGTWLDYLELLNHFRKDLRSAKYVCPPNLDKAHNKLVAKKAAADKKRADAYRREKIEAAESEYIKAKKQFFGIEICKGNISIKVLESVKDFLAEGDLHKHCLFTNEYYSKADSLIFSAKVDGVPVETIELSLKTMKVVQSRGLGNQPTAFNKEIVKLMNSNINQIKKKYKSKTQAA